MVKVAVLGAGPTGLEAALAAHKRGWDVTLYEAERHVGGYVRRWGHVQLFTPWSMNVGPLAREVVGMPTPDSCPTGVEYAAYLDRVAGQLPDVRLSTRVEQIAREGLLKSQEIGTEARGRTPFLLLVTGADGRESRQSADVVLDCTGTYGHPNATGDGGVPAIGEGGCGDRIVRQIPAVDGSWSGRKVLLVGAGNSAQTAARDLVAAGAELVWAVRHENPTWGAVDGDPLPDRAALVASSRVIAASGAVRTGVVVTALHREGGEVTATLRDGTGEASELVVDVVVSLTGAVGDSRMYRQLQVHECYATEGPITLAATLLGSAGGDCLAQTSAGVDVLRNPEPYFYVLGSKSYGRNNTFLLRVGFEQVAEVFGALDSELLVPV